MPPFQGLVGCDAVSQGFALGFTIVPLRGGSGGSGGLRIIEDFASPEWGGMV